MSDREWSDEQVENCRQFLDANFTGGHLGQMMAGLSGHKKEGRVDRVALALASGALDGAEVAGIWAGQSRRMSAVRVLSQRPEELPASKDVKELFTGEFEGGWFGPVSDHVEDGVCWYIRAQFIEEWKKDAASGIARQVKAPYFVFCAVRPSSVCLTWKNRAVVNEFDEATGLLGRAQSYPYWYQVHAAVSELSEMLGVDLVPPDLKQVLLRDIWDKYSIDPAYRFHPRRIRAESDGLFLSAHAGGVAEFEVKGVEALTDYLADIALHECGIKNAKTELRLKRTLLRTVIADWGPRSFELELTRLASEAEAEERLFRAHAYFGEQESGVDSLQHFVNYDNWGGSAQTIRFILDQLQCE